MTVVLVYLLPYAAKLWEVCLEICFFSISK